MIRSIEDLKHMKEAYLEKMGQYSHLCMVCYGTGCMSSGCKDVRDRAWLDGHLRCRSCGLRSAG